MVKEERESESKGVINFDPTGRLLSAKKWEVLLLVVALPQIVHGKCIDVNAANGGRDGLRCRATFEEASEIVRLERHQ